MRLKSNVAVIAGAAVVLGAILAAGFYSARNPASNPAAGEPPVVRFVRNPEPAPEFALTDIDGKPLSLAASRGKVTLINFWATWCGPCRAEVPDLVALQAQYPEHLQVVGLSIEDPSVEKIREFAEQYGINYPVAVTPEEVRAQYGGVLALPTSFLLDTEGRIVQKYVGLRSRETLDREIRALAGLPVDARIETFEDVGQINLANASRATELPGVDLSRLDPEQRKAALRRLNEESCPCGCTLTYAQCRINDSTCPVSLKAANEIVDQVAQSASGAP